MKYDFTKIKVYDIDGKPFIDGKYKAHEQIGTLIYMMTKNLGLVITAQDIYKGKEVELESQEIEEVKRVINDPQVTLSSFIKKAMLDYIESVLAAKKK